MSTSNQQEVNTSDSTDVMSLPPRREVHRKKRKMFKQIQTSTIDEPQDDDFEQEELNHEPTLFYHRLMHHIVLILFLLLSMGIPVYYYFVMP